MYRTLPALAAVLLLAGAAVACSDEKPDAKPPTRTATPKEKAAAAEPKKLGDVYSAKLDAVSDGATAHCQSPSSTACGNDIGAIMIVVSDIEKDIDANGGASNYPKSTQQIAKMRAAQEEYDNNGCEGDPGADDPNSDCWGSATITVGATILTMTLQTDDLT
ncbi:hypothetical protein [Streptomyces mirabilis]|uniref:hypothetical protein n=1 Tax=Streptomyces mirabilis TaxID=68239 RepID=UPI00340ADFD6